LAKTTHRKKKNLIKKGRKNSRSHKKKKKGRTTIYKWPKDELIKTLRGEGAWTAGNGNGGGTTQTKKQTNGRTCNRGKRWMPKKKKKHREESRKGHLKRPRLKQQEKFED